MAATVSIDDLIVSIPDVCGGKSRIDGSRITVQYIVKEIKAGVTPEEILEDKPYLSLTAIYTALAYYYANQESLNAESAKYDRGCEHFIAEYT